MSVWAARSAHTLNPAPGCISFTGQTNAVYNYIHRSDMVDNTYTLYELSDLVLAQFDHGYNKDDIVHYFMARGWPHRSALRFVSDTLTSHACQRPALPTPRSVEHTLQLAFLRMLLLAVLVSVVIVALSTLPN